MTGAVPPPVAPAAPAAAAAPAPVVLAEATVVRLPERLQDVGRAVVVGGTVAGETPDGLTRVRTAAGEVLVKSQTPLPADKPVTLQIAAGTPPGKALVLAQPAAAGQAAAPPPGGAGSAATVLLSTATMAPVLPTATAPAPPLAVGTVLPAIVIAAAPRPSGASAAAAPPGVAAPTQPLPPPAAAGAAPATPTPAAGGQPPPSVPAGPTSPVLANPSATPPPPAPQASAAPPAPAAGGAPAAATPPAAAAPGTVAPALAPAAPPPGPTAAGAVTTAPAPVATAPATATTAPPAPPATFTAVPSRPAPADAGLPASQPPAPGGASPQAPQPAPAPAPARAAVPVPQPAAAPAAPAPAPAPDGGAALATTQPAGSTPSAARPTGTTQSTVQPPPALVQGATVALRILSVSPPGAPDAPMPAAPPSPAAAGGETVLSGTVAGVTNQGQPILATKDGMLALNTRAAAPPGTRITAALAEPGAPPAAVATAPPPIDLVTLAASGRDWPALRQVLASLGGLDRALAQTLIGSVLPQPNRKLGAALAFFLSAARGGDARGWLGAEAAGSLERSGQGALLERLEREFRDAQPPPEAAAGEWRPVAMPMLDSTGLHPIRVCVRPIGEEEAEDGAERRERGSRFLIDVELSRLGPMQLDGMVRERRFDLILRSHAALTPELRQELTRVFADSLAAVGYAGGLSFQSGARSWVALTRGGGGLGVTA